MARLKNIFDTCGIASVVPVAAILIAGGTWVERATAQQTPAAQSMSATASADT